MNKVKFPVNESRNSENIDRMASNRLNVTNQYTTHIHTLLSIEYNLQATQFTFSAFLHLLVASNNLHTTIFVSPILFSQLLFISKFTMKSHELYIFSLEWRLRCIVFTTTPWKIARKKSELAVNYMVRTCEPANKHKLHSC